MSIFINIYLEDGDRVLAFRKKNTFSAVGLGHERIPFLSTQHNAWKLACFHSFSLILFKDKVVV